MDHIWKVIAPIVGALAASAAYDMWHPNGSEARLAQFEKRLHALETVSSSAASERAGMDTLVPMRTDTNGLGTTDCRFEIRQYVTSGLWTDGVAAQACAEKVTAAEERTAQIFRERRAAAAAPSETEIITTMPTMRPPPNKSAIEEGN